MKKMKLKDALRRILTEAPNMAPPSPMVSPQNQGRRNTAQQTPVQFNRRDLRANPKVAKALDAAQTELQNLEDVSQRLRQFLGNADIQSASQYLGTLQQVSANAAQNVMNIQQATVQSYQQESIREDHALEDPDSRQGRMESKILKALAGLKAFAGEAEFSIQKGNYERGFDFLSQLVPGAEQASSMLRAYIDAYVKKEVVTPTD